MRLSVGLGSGLVWSCVEVRFGLVWVLDLGQRMGGGGEPVSD
jgi:hypothetical protein